MSDYAAAFAVEGLPEADGCVAVQVYFSLAVQTAGPRSACLADV